MRIDGFELACRDGEVDLARAVAHNLARAPEMVARNAASLSNVDAFRPDAVITDFDSFSHAYSKTRGLPIVSIDNLNVITRCELDPSVIDDASPGRGATYALTRLKTAGCNHYVVASFFPARVKDEYVSTTTMTPPVVREEIVASRPRDAGHVLVYQPSADPESLRAVLATAPRHRFIVYGRYETEHTSGNCALRPINEQKFVEDLVSARAVVAHGGASLIGEAIYLGKPLCAVPIHGHFEQAMNARYLAALGYGSAPEQLDAASLAEFLSSVPRYAARLSSTPPQDGNRYLGAVLDRIFGAP